MPKISLSKALFLSAASAAAALLFAPKSGKELRAELKTEAEKLKETGEEKAHELVEDFKESYLEVEKELEAEQAKLDAKQAQLSQTIEEIEKDLAQKQVDKKDDTVIDPAQASHAVYQDESLGDVKGTPLEPTQDEVIPKDKIDEALHDNYLSNDKDFQVDKNNVADEKEASVKVNPNK
jgi:gas vesicle protein